MEPDAALQQLSDILAIDQYIIAQEKHEDGASHLHCWLKCTKKYNIKDANKLDLKDEEGMTYHGNYQGCRSNKAVIEYCTKGGKYISSMAK